MDRMIPVRRSDDGFATAMAVVLCAGLAVVSVALVDLGLNSARRVAADIEQETERQALRTAIAEMAADLVDRPDTGLGTTVRQYDGLKVEVAVTNELAKANVFQATESQLVQALSGVGASTVSDIASRITAARLQGNLLQLSLDEFLETVDLRPQESACLREKLTVHASSVDPFAVAGDVPPAKDAGIVNLRARIVGGRTLDLTHEAIMAITGDARSPLLLLGERTFRSSQIQGCFDETT